MINEQEASRLVTRLAKLVHAEKGSDIILNTNARPAIKVDGIVRYVDGDVLQPGDTDQVAKALMSPVQYQRFAEQSEMNFMLDYPGIAHFRTNVFKQRGETGLVMRLIPLEIPSMEELRLPELMEGLASLKRGLVLFSGTTGVGKSASLASMIDYRNEHFSDHIVTVEEPIEFVHRNKKSVVTQREVGIDTHSYSAALKSALRQAPDVVLVGEILDVDVMEQAIAFANTGHLVLATIHGGSTRLAIERIINMFPHEMREQLRLDLSNNLKALITQRLLKKADGNGRIVAMEILRGTPHLRQLIREARLDEIAETMERSTLKEGIITMDNYIFDLYEQGEVDFDECLQYVDSPTNFRLKVRSVSQRSLPEELQFDESKWHVEKSASEVKRQNTWGSFTGKSS